MRYRQGLAAAVAVCFLAAGFGAGAGDKKPAEGAKADLDAFRAYLAKQYEGKKWQTGPTRIDSPEIRQAYGKRRFYAVFSSPPLPPGAALKELIERYQRAMEDFRKNYVSVTAAVDDGGKVTPLRKPADYNDGLMKVASDEDAKVAAAAVLALHGADRVGPGPVP